MGCCPFFRQSKIKQHDYLQNNSSKREEGHSLAQLNNLKQQNRNHKSTEQKVDHSEQQKNQVPLQTRRQSKIQSSLKQSQGIKQQTHPIIKEQHHPNQRESNTSQLKNKIKQDKNKLKDTIVKQNYRIQNNKKQNQVEIKFTEKDLSQNDITKTLKYPNQRQETSSHNNNKKQDTSSDNKQHKQDINILNVEYNSVKQTQRQNGNKPKQEIQIKQNVKQTALNTSQQDKNINYQQKIDQIYIIGRPQAYIEQSRLNASKKSLEITQSNKQKIKFSRSKGISKQYVINKDKKINQWRINNLHRCSCKQQNYGQHSQLCQCFLYFNQNCYSQLCCISCVNKKNKQKGIKNQFQDDSSLMYLEEDRSEQQKQQNYDSQSQYYQARELINNQIENFIEIYSIQQPNNFRNQVQFVINQYISNTNHQERNQNQIQQINQNNYNQIVQTCAQHIIEQITCSPQLLYSFSYYKGIRKNEKMQYKGFKKQQKKISNKPQKKQQNQSLKKTQLPIQQQKPYKKHTSNQSQQQYSKNEPHWGDPSPYSLLRSQSQQKTPIKGKSKNETKKPKKQNGPIDYSRLQICKCNMNGCLYNIKCPCRINNRACNQDCKCCECVNTAQNRKKINTLINPCRNQYNKQIDMDKCKYKYQNEQEKKIILDNKRKNQNSVKNQKELIPSDNKDSDSVFIKKQIVEY